MPRSSLFSNIEKEDDILPPLVRAFGLLSVPLVPLLELISGGSIELLFEQQF